ncbi:hypothetical protein TNCV_96591 [Trichonephila clavipes]|nr:hypothetical protein TNCV_96591 [Trichonephila clavipes]
MALYRSPLTVRLWPSSFLKKYGPMIPPAHKAHQTSGMVVEIMWLQLRSVMKCFLTVWEVSLWLLHQHRCRNKILLQPVSDVSNDPMGAFWSGICYDVTEFIILHPWSSNTGHIG